MSAKDCQTPAELQRLRRYLVSKQCPAGTLPLNAVRGCFFSLAATPATLSAQCWWHSTFNGTPPDHMPVAIKGTLDSLRREADGSVHSLTPHLPRQCRVLTEPATNFSPVSALHHWSAGFNRGLEYSRAHWSRVLVLTPDMAESVHAFWRLLGFFDNAGATADILRADTIGTIEKLREVRRNMNRAMRDYAELSLILREPDL